MPDHRPSADALLARIKEKDRARLRIYIGAAPGVGKTYEMLQEAHALRARGLDVVVGFVETYGRADTEAQLQGSRSRAAPADRVPRRRRWRRWTSTPSSRASREVCVVDELAHTNVPGSRHAQALPGRRSSSSMPAST